MCIAFREVGVVRGSVSNSLSWRVKCGCAVVCPEGGVQKKDPHGV